VNYTGFPTPEIHWFREGIEIQPSRDFKISHLYQKSFLVVPEVFLEDAGTFTVRAISAVGMAECRALLVVEGTLDFREIYTISFVLNVISIFSVANCVQYPTDIRCTFYQCLVVVLFLLFSLF